MTHHPVSLLARIRLGIDRLFQSQRYPLWALLVVLVVATGLRLYGLTFQSLWSDELASMDLMLPGPFAEKFWRRIGVDVHPPGYELLLWCWAQLFGKSEWALRMSSVVPGVMGVWATAALGARLFSRSAGLAAAMFAAVSPVLIGYSQELRAYALTYALAAWLAVRCLDLLKAPPGLSTNKRGVFACSAIAMLSAYVHYSGLLVAIGLLAMFVGYALLAARAHAVKFLTVCLVAVIGYLPWGLTGLLDDLSRGGLTWLPAPKLEQLLSFGTVPLPGFAYLAIVSLVVVSGGFDRVSKMGAEAGGADCEQSEGRAKFPAGLFCIVWCVGLVGGVYLKSIYGASMYNTRNLLVALPPLLVMLGAACVRGTAESRMVDTLAPALVAACVCWHLVAGKDYYDVQSKQPFRQITEDAVAIGNYIEMPILALSYGDPSYFDYYFEQLGSDKRVLSRTSSKKDLDVAVRAQLSSGASHVMVMAGHLQLGKLASSWRRDFKVIAHKRRKPRTELVVLGHKADAVGTSDTKAK